MSQLYSNSIFWIEVEKIEPNPYQPRKEFNQEALEALAESIRQYGVLQPLVVTRHEQQKPDGGIAVSYELIAGERRLRAAKIAGVAQVPVVIRTGEDNNLMKLELSIIENLQREDLNPVDRAKAFQRFVDEFHYKHSEIAKKIGKSREYVSNSLRLLALPQEVLDALAEGKITEGHARPIMMLNDRPEEQMTLFKEVLYKKLTVRDAESIARRVASDKIRKKSRQFDPEILKMEKNLTEQLGARVHIEPREVGGKITIDFFSDDDLKNLLAFMYSGQHLDEESDVSDLDSENRNGSQDSLSQEALQAEEEEQKEQDNIAPDSDNNEKDNENSDGLAQEKSSSSTGDGGDMEDHPAIPIAPSPSQNESHTPQIDDSMNTIQDDKSVGFSEGFKETAERIEKEKKHKEEMLRKSKDVFAENIVQRNTLAEDTVEEVPVPKVPTKNETENEMPNKVTEKNLETSPLAEAMFGKSSNPNNVGAADGKNSGSAPKVEENIQKKPNTNHHSEDDELYSIKNFSI